SSSLPTHTKSSAVPPESFIPRAKLDAVRADFVSEITIVRPALFTGDAEPKASDNVKVGEDISVYTVTRNQVARFVADECLPPRGEWVNR
ncbi:UNVERIFIED_CONTAM: SDR family oxidoreductase, partial [Bacteroidetes bacterium 56_B9]